MTDTDMDSLKKELERLDRIEEKVPDGEVIIRKLVIQEKKQKSRFIREISMFFIFACLFVTVVLQTLAGAPIFFIILQTVVFISAPVLAFLDRRRIRRMERWYR